MQENPYENNTEKSVKESSNLQKNRDFSPPLTQAKQDDFPELAKFSPTFSPSNLKYDDDIQTRHKQLKRPKRETENLTEDEYQALLAELNNNAENKHFVLFFGQRAAGKTWIIGSVLHYMKNYLGGTIRLDDTLSDEETELFYQLQDRFNGVMGAKKLTRTDVNQFFELRVFFKPKETNKPPIDIVFIDAAGEHSLKVFNQKGDSDTGKLNDYFTAILESKVNTKLAFVYDQSVQDEKGQIPQMNVLSAVFDQIQKIQDVHQKKFPKALLLSKADKIFADDLAAVERNGYDAMQYALEKIPSFANSFFNESPDNKTIFYKIGRFSVNSDLIMEFDKDCPERFFNWLYKSGTGVSAIKELTCWDKFKRWFKGQ